MIEYRKDDQVLFRGQVVRIASVHLHIGGETKYLIEFADKTFSKVSGAALLHLEESESKLPALSFSMSKFLRQPVKLRRVLK